jgi:Polyketide cyclase / dehydrase and lipid transport
MNEFTIVTVIARTVDEVFAVLTDLERMPLWVPGMAEASVTSDGPLKAGSALSYRGAFLGRGLEMPLGPDDPAAARGPLGPGTSGCAWLPRLVPRARRGVLRAGRVRGFDCWQNGKHRPGSSRAEGR